jgi:hypothetical protein
MTPVTPDRPDVQKDGFVLLASLREGLVSPLLPVDRLARGTAQISARGLCQLVARGVETHAAPSQLETRNWKMENGKWKLETRKWKLERRKLEGITLNSVSDSNFHFPISIFHFPISIF